MEVLIKTVFLRTEEGGEALTVPSMCQALGEQARDTNVQLGPRSSVGTFHLVHGVMGCVSAPSLMEFQALACC